MERRREEGARWERVQMERKEHFVVRSFAIYVALMKTPRAPSTDDGLRKFGKTSTPHETYPCTWLPSIMFH
jgi:hypothetical protein